MNQAACGWDDLWNLAEPSKRSARIDRVADVEGSASETEVELLFRDTSHVTSEFSWVTTTLEILCPRKELACRSSD